MTKKEELLMNAAKITNEEGLQKLTMEAIAERTGGLSIYGVSLFVIVFHLHCLSLH